MFDESNQLIASRANLLVESIDARKKKTRTEAKMLVEPPAPKPGTKPYEAKPEAKPKMVRETPYLQVVDALPADVLYRPIYNSDVKAVVVQINKSHPFYKAVFSTAKGEGRDSLPRRATTATQQLL